MIGPQLLEIALLHYAPCRAGRRWALAFATVATVSLTAGGCRNDGLVASVAGSGSLTTTGAVALSGSGHATFYVSGSRQSTFGMEIYHFSQGAVIWHFQIVQDNSGRLEVGSYNIGPLSDIQTKPVALLAYYTGDPAHPTIRAFNSTSGQLVITTSSQSEVRGTFAFAATEVGGTNSISGNGSFDACAAVCP